VDGVFLTANPQQLVLQGSVANIPFITGDCDDEGTIFSFPNLDITLVYYLIILTTLICLPIYSTDAQLAEYLQMYWFPTATTVSVQELLTFYPQDPTQGSPYDTGNLNELSSQFKRIASFQGDAVFQAPRRFFLQQRFYHQNTWAFCESDSGTS
jgi:acetylcholinesterase